MAGKAHVGVGVGSLALILFLVGFASPYWSLVSYEGSTFTQGLWKACSKPGGCVNVLDAPNLEGWFKAVQALECLALIAGLTGLGLSIVPLVKSDIPHRGTLFKSAMGAFITAGILGLIGTIIYGIETREGLHFAFALTIIGCLLFGAVGSLIGSES